MARSVSKVFARISDWLSKWMGSHWAFLIAAVLVALGLLTFGVNDTNIGISIATPC
jgi:low affinity Fe/Cu permease